MTLWVMFLHIKDQFNTNKINLRGEADFTFRRICQTDGKAYGILVQMTPAVGVLLTGYSSDKLQTDIIYFGFVLTSVTHWEYLSI